MKVFRKFFASLLALAMTLSGLTTAAFAEGEQYDLALAFDASLGEVSINDQKVEAAGAKTEWKVDENTAIAANSEYINDDNIQVSSVYATTINSSEVTINGRSYTHNINVRLNADPGATLSETSGSTALIVKTKTTGTFSYDYRRQADSSAPGQYTSNNGKDIKISRKNDDNTYESPSEGKLQVSSSDDSYGFVTKSIDVVAGEEYIIWARGTTGNFYGFTFEPKETIKVNAGETVTIKSTPNENGLIGEVSASSDDGNIQLTKNEGYTECTFTMPAKNVNVKVDFINKSVQNEINTKLTFDMIKGNNTAENNINDDLDFSQVQGVDFSIGYADLKWESSDPETISISGVVNTSTEEKSVTLTAVCTFQDYTNLRITKDFNLTVPADTDHTGAVSTAKEALTLGDTSAVKRNIDLPIKGRRGTIIEWSSNNNAVISIAEKEAESNTTCSAIVTRQREIDTDVELTATISRGGVSDTKIFNVKVLGYTPVEINRVALSNADGRIVASPMDGGYVSHIAYVDSIAENDRTDDEVLIAAVYDKNKKITAHKIFNLTETTNPENKDKLDIGGEETIIKLQKGDLPVNKDSEVKVFAFSSLQAMKPIAKKSFNYDTTVKTGATVYVAGDSTACVYGAGGFPRTGWAEVLDNFFNNDIIVNDLALSGRSSKNFRKETNYETIVNGLKAGDYFVIQFGHNDSKVGEEERYTNPVGDRFTDGTYKNSIYQYYVLPALEKGANPIITTSISRLNTTGTDAGLEAYTNAAKELADELGLPYIDLYAKTSETVKTLGLENGRKLYYYARENDSRFLGEANLPASFANSIGKTKMKDVKNFSSTIQWNYSDADEKKKGDNTHINYYGAQMYAQYFCDELEAIGHPLAGKRSVHTITLDDIPEWQ